MPQKHTPTICFMQEESSGFFSIQPEDSSSIGASCSKPVSLTLG